MNLFGRHSAIGSTGHDVQQGRERAFDADRSRSCPGTINDFDVFLHCCFCFLCECCCGWSSFFISEFKFSSTSRLSILHHHTLMPTQIHSDPIPTTFFVPLFDDSVLVASTSWSCWVPPRTSCCFCVWFHTGALWHWRWWTMQCCMFAPNYPLLWIWNKMCNENRLYEWWDLTAKWQQINFISQTRIPGKKKKEERSVFYFQTWICESHQST